MRPRHSNEVDVEQLADDLRMLADEIQAGTVIVQSLSANQVVQSDEPEELELQFAVIADRDGYFGNGYTVPYER